MARVKPSYDLEEVRVAQVRQLFRNGLHARTESGVLMFFGWLHRHRPELLPSPKYGDPCQILKVELSGLWAD